MTRLPAAGRKGRTPVWPLIDDVRKAAMLEHAEGTVNKLRAELLEAEGPRRVALQRKLDAAEVEVLVLTKQLEAQRGLEKTLWKDLWKTPQAVAWERLGWIRDVAQYVRWKVLAELGDLDAAKEARQLSDRIGLTPMAMLRLRWEVVDEEQAAADRPRRRPARPAKASGASGEGTEAAPAADPRAILRAV